MGENENKNIVLIGQFYKHPFPLICICLILSIIAIYWPVYNYDFVGYDDGTYITDNTNIQSGLNWRSIRWAFTTISYAGHYWHPITWLSHTLDYQFFKNWAGGYHLVNVFFHIANTLVLFYVLMRMTGAVWPSAFVAAAFALHPLHVESVAWIAERKDLLSTFFWLLTMLAYVRYAESHGFWRYLTAFILFVLGLMSKPMLVTLPFVLLLLDFWPLQRKIFWKLPVEKIPFFICSFACCAVTFLSQRNSSMASLETIGFRLRVNNAIVSYLAYIIKMIWPSRLAVLYPHPDSGLPTIKAAGCGLLLVLISIYFIYEARRYRFPAVGWFWYLGTLVPVIGLVQVGAQAMADRYTYMTLTGLFIIIAWGTRVFIPRRLLTLLATVTLIALGITASRQLKHWKNSLMLFEHALQVTENNYIITDNYANILFEQGRFDEAIECFKKSLKINPNSAAAYNNLGAVLLHAGKTQQAIECFNLAIKYEPNEALSYFNLALALQNQDRLQEAVSYYKQALAIKPDYTKAYLNLAAVLVKLDRPAEAVEYYNKVIAIEPTNVIAHGRRGLVLAALGKIDEAIEEFRFVLNIRPDDAQMHRNLGIFLEKKGDITGAIKSYRTALRIDPNNENLRQLLDEALKSQKDH